MNVNKYLCMSFFLISQTLLSMENDELKRNEKEKKKMEEIARVQIAQKKDAQSFFYSYWNKLFNYLADNSQDQATYGFTFTPNKE